MDGWFSWRLASLLLLGALIAVVWAGLHDIKLEIRNWKEFTINGR